MNETRVTFNFEPQKTGRKEIRRHDKKGGKKYRCFSKNFTKKTFRIGEGGVIQRGGEGGLKRRSSFLKMYVSKTLNCRGIRQSVRRFQALRHVNSCPPGKMSKNSALSTSKFDRNFFCRFS